MISYCYQGEALIPEFWLMIILNVIGWSTVIHQIYWTIMDFKRILGVKLLRI
jgi:hypothetical protein